MAKNADLNKATRDKKDEFYTQLSMIEEECWHYEEQFRGKTILCNCDDPYESNFFKYFAMRFNALGLKKLICTCYDGSPLAGQEISFEELDAMKEGKRHAYKVELTEVKDVTGDGAVGLDDVEKMLRSHDLPVTLLEGSGDFASEECLALLDEADICVTNPPFSRWRDFLAILVKHEKQFLIVGNVNAITYKEVFPLIKAGKIWMGASIHSGDREFRVPDSYPLKAAGYRVDEQGRKYIRVKGVRWWTNLDYKERHEDLDLYKRYDPEENPTYDNYDAIEVSATADIPYDYDGVMGVPITFLDKYNPEQFDIICLANGNTRTNVPQEILDFVSYVPNDKDKGGLGVIDGKRVYARILIKSKGRCP